MATLFTVYSNPQKLCFLRFLCVEVWVLIYCTFAVTAAFAFSVNLQVAVFCPPLAHAPDHTALRPLETPSVIGVPAASDAVMLLPVSTLMPAGVLVTVSPARPVAVTVRVIICGPAAGGFTVRVAERVVPPPETEMMTAVGAVTADVAMLNPPAIAPAEMNTEGDTAATAGLLLVI